MSLLCQLWSLNESIQEFKSVLGEHRGRSNSYSPPLPHEGEEYSARYYGDDASGYLNSVPEHYSLSSSSSTDSLEFGQI